MITALVLLSSLFTANAAPPSVEKEATAPTPTATSTIERRTWHEGRLSVLFPIAFPAKEPTRSVTGRDTNHHLHYEIRGTVYDQMTWVFNVEEPLAAPLDKLKVLTPERIAMVAKASLMGVPGKKTDLETKPIKLAGLGTEGIMTSLKNSYGEQEYLATFPADKYTTISIIMFDPKLTFSEAQFRAVLDSIKLERAFEPTPAQ